MAKRYRPVDRDQPYLFPLSMRDWLPPDHPVWLVITAVGGHLDTSAFHALRRAGGAGAAGYDPDMLVMVLVWAYAHQVTSSRRIGQLRGTGVAFRVACAGNLPDHATIARFRSGFPGVVSEFFAQVLALCARLGMGKPGVVALDGMKIAANASKSANRAGERLRKLAAETVAARARAGQAGDDLFGEGVRGDEVPEDAWRPGRRDERIAAALAGLRAGREAAAAERARLEEERVAAAAAGTPRAGNPPAGVAVELARMRVERARAAQQAKAGDWQARNDASLACTGRPLRGHRPAPAGDCTGVRQAQAKLQAAQARAAAAAARAAEREKNHARSGPARNLTDPDARLMPVRGGGFIEGYNAQNVASEDGLIIAARLAQDTTGAAWSGPMPGQAQDTAAFITARQPAARAPAGRDAGPGQDGGPAGLFPADAGYCSGHNLTIPGPDRLIAAGKTRDLEKTALGPALAVAPWHSGAIAAMAARLATAEGITAYRQRSHIAETPHGQIKHNMRFRQLSLRGHAKAAAEWTFTCAVHNLFKAITTGHLTPTALAGLPGQAGP